ncbi:hypothetical protein EFY87_03650 [Flexivirga caeni]|uniref:Uncharacterized protein n=1 Tax=Flexivirga caeni TaxID=2294115 RepID=A0A3M9MHY2_9MICO|nr:hypothetical protein EFY87_03650 [Flexivirga caeni]
MEETWHYGRVSPRLDTPVIATDELTGKPLRALWSAPRTIRAGDPAGSVRTDWSTMLQWTGHYQPGGFGEDDRSRWWWRWREPAERMWPVHASPEARIAIVRTADDVRACVARWGDTTGAVSYGHMAQDGVHGIWVEGEALADRLAGDEKNLWWTQNREKPSNQTQFSRWDVASVAWLDPSGFTVGQPRAAAVTAERTSPYELFEDVRGRRIVTGRAVDDALEWDLAEARGCTFQRERRTHDQNAPKAGSTPRR